MQMMVIEFARNVLGYKDATSSEFISSPSGEAARGLHFVIDMMEEQKSITQMGGTMRLGAYECELKEGSRTFEAYRPTPFPSLYGGEKKALPLKGERGEGLLIKERHRHRYEFNSSYQKEYEAAGMKCVGINPDTNLVEIVEVPSLKWYIGTQFHPEYSSTVLHPHPLFMSFIKACVNW
jgi:CTP synthase